MINEYIDWNNKLSSEIRRFLTLRSFPKNMLKEKKLKKIIMYLDNKTIYCKDPKIRQKANVDKKYYENQLIEYLKNKKGGNLK